MPRVKILGGFSNRDVYVRRQTKRNWEQTVGSRKWESSGMAATTARGYGAVLWVRRERTEAGLIQAMVLGYIVDVERGC
jgi:hypothetical protein